MYTISKIVDIDPQPPILASPARIRRSRQHAQPNHRIQRRPALFRDAAYGALRHLLTRPGGIDNIVRAGSTPLTPVREVRADQYGIRTMLTVFDQPIKFEIVLEARIELEVPEITESICGVATLSRLDMATSTLLANSDRWADDEVFSRDVIDLSMMKPMTALLRAAIAKAETAYGDCIRQDLGRAIERMQEHPGWLDRCMLALSMNLPKAVVWKHIRALRKVSG